ncbi:MAG TPA: hypothetical protein VFF06_07770 [Polyangia bacterium]|nr:hypothetical protein [Polyangia bacterium]
MKKQFARSLQWFRQELGSKPMKASLYETIKQFELRSDETTKVVTSISAKNAGSRIFFRVATLREHALGDGTVRRSPWLGVREMALKSELEKRALEFIAEETARLEQPGMTFSA